MLSSKETRYLDSFLNISNVKNICREDLSEGRLPEAENEVLVSREYADEYGIVPESKAEFKNIWSEKYNNVYSGMPDVYEYFPDGIVIAGIVEKAFDEISYDLYISERIWEKLVYDYYEYFCGEGVVFVRNGNYKELMEAADRAGISFDEPAINRISQFDDILNDIKLVLYALLVISVGINLIMLSTFINISIRENRKNIGILRSLGVKMKDCCHIFSLEFYFMHVISQAVAAAVINVAVLKVNGMYMQQSGNVKYCIIGISIPVYIIMAVSQLVIGRISISVPVNRLKRKKPVEIIREE